MEPLAASAGDVLIRQGEPGDLFYVIADGEVTVSTAAGFTTDLGCGEGFGEIALLNGIARTATVAAKTESALYSLSKEAFLTAVTGVADVHTAARGIAESRLAEQAAATSEAGAGA
jgi:CRP-like cAMP-binding protein